jgi:two-component system CheB/CheR fusion protein
VAVQPDAAETVQPEAKRVQREVDRVLARYGPAGVIVDEELNVIEFRGNIHPYLEFSPGAASLSLHRLARPGLWVALSPALQEARQNDVPVHREAAGLEGVAAG